MSAHALPKADLTATSLIVSGGIIAAWLALHVHALWFLDAAAHPILAVANFLGLTWLSVGLFIIAHDAMHGSVVPGVRAPMRRWASLSCGCMPDFRGAR